MKYAVGVDIGGTHVEAAMVNLTDYSLLPDSRVYRKIAHREDAESILSAWSGAIGDVVKQAVGVEGKDVLGVGIAIPGPFDCVNGVSLMEHKFTSLYSMSIRNELAKRTGFAADRIRFKNDAESFLLGEVLRNGGIETAVGITLGTGFGSAYYENGESRDAELWCVPYRESIIEEYTTTRWFVKEYKERWGETIDGVKCLVEKYDSDKRVWQLFGEFGVTLRDFLIPILLEKQADALVLGGSITRSHQLFTKELKDCLPKGVRLIASSETEVSAMVGAASLLSAL